MPCNSPYSDSELNGSYAKELELKNKLNNVEAKLCAILRELEKANQLNVVKEAEKNGKVSIINEFYEEHKVEDDTRLNNMLNTLSQHEIDMLKKKLGI
jgi:hypothetical protein